MIGSEMLRTDRRDLLSPTPVGENRPERCILIERVKAGMKRARLEGRQIGRARLDVNRQQVIADRRSGMSLTQVAKKHGISRASVCRLMKEASGNPDATAHALVGNMCEQASAAGTAQ